jgi:hypothetical protein
MRRHESSPERTLQSSRDDPSIARMPVGSVIHVESCDFVVSVSGNDSERIQQIVIKSRPNGRRRRATREPISGHAGGRLYAGIGQ